MADSGDNNLTDITESSEYFGLLNIPAEIIEAILSNKCLTIKDILNVSLTCKQFHGICVSNELWKRKLKQRWPSMLQRYSMNISYNWMKEYRHRHNFGLKLRMLVSQLSPKYFKKEEIPNSGFSDFKYLLSQHEQAAECLIDELLAIVHDGKSHENLTEKFYAVKALRYVQQQYLRKKVAEFLVQPPQKQTLEEGAVLISQWCQTSEPVCLSTVKQQLDQLASEVRHVLQMSCPKHPVITQHIAYQELTSDLWTPDQCRTVLNAINQVLFSQHHFEGNTKSYYKDTNSYIDKVLKVETGIPITLSIVYEAVARRLGVLCEPVNFPSHFLLRWKQRPLASADQMYVYIDAFNKGKFHTLDELPQAMDINVEMVQLEHMRITEPKQVFERMLRNLIVIGRQQGVIADQLLGLRNPLELFLLFCPDDFDMKLLLARISLHLNINISEVVDILDLMLHQYPVQVGMISTLLTAARDKQENPEPEDEEVIVKRRNAGCSVRFSIGLVMKHKRYNYMCVIYGWDPVCKASQEWIIQMGVHQLPNQHKQPFYNVFVEDGSNRYAAEENLEFAETPTFVPHPEVGRYFQTFQATHFIPNSELLGSYPDDLEVTSQLTAKRYS